MVHRLTKLFEWQTPEFVYREKRVDWYWALGILVIAVFIVAVIDKNFPLAILVLLAGSLLFFFAQKKPQSITAEISDQGIKINSSFYPYHNIDSFWIHERNDSWELLIHIHRSITPIMTIPITDDIEPDLLRVTLLDYLQEIKSEEPFSHKLSDKIGL